MRCFIGLINKITTLNIKILLIMKEVYILLLGKIPK